MEGLNASTVSLEEFIALFAPHGGTPDRYVRDHFARFQKTLINAKERVKPGARVVDVGAHWLHQALLWRIDGHPVMGIDIPGTFQTNEVQSLATSYDIGLVPCSDWASAEELSVVPENSADVILFAEILEHITFNPIEMWKQLYRILAPGGRIIVTTPNYYGWRGNALNPFRYLLGMGGGIPVEEVIGLGTYAHHWKEYSLKEIIKYFRLLSPDFQLSVARHLPTFTYSASPAKALVQRALDIAPILRPNLHVEISLPRKSAGVTAAFHY